MGAFRRKSAAWPNQKNAGTSEYQRRGFGQIILNQLEAKAIQLGYTECAWTPLRSKSPPNKCTRKTALPPRRGKCRREVIYYHKSLISEKTK